jgi:hypothetical protein
VVKEKNFLPFLGFFVFAGGGKLFFSAPLKKVVLLKKNGFGQYH